MPDLDIITPNGPRRVFALLHDARPVLLNLGEFGSIDITPTRRTRGMGRDGTQTGLTEAITTWFGPPAADRHGAVVASHS